MPCSSLTVVFQGLSLRPRHCLNNHLTFHPTQQVQYVSLFPLVVQEKKYLHIVCFHLPL